MQTFQRVFMTMVVAVITLIVPPAWGCDAMGPNRHLGVVSQIEPNAGTFTIIDAQTERSLTFKAAKPILDQLSLNREFVITFRMEGSTMQAESVVPAS